MRLVLRGARVIDPFVGLDEVADVVIEAGVVVSVGRGAADGVRAGERDTVVHELDGRWVLPGFVDLHAHLREPGLEYKEDITTGTRAAAAGGFTTVCVMPNTKPVNDNRAVTEMMVAKAASHGRVRVRPIGCITRGQAGRELTEMADLRDAGCVAVSDDGRCVTDAGVMRRAMEYARTFGLPVVQHAEDHALTQGAQMHEGAVATRLGLKGWPRVAEDHIVARDLMLAELTGARYHLAHASTRGSAALLREAKSRGLRVSAEVTPHHLTLTDEAVLGYRTACKVNPPLREAEDREALIEALADGTLDCVATDHAPHAMMEKDTEFSQAALGMVGLETALPLLLSLVREGRVSRARLVDALTVAPARAFGFEPPSLRAGAVADVVVIDPERAWAVDPKAFHSKGRNTPFAGWEVRGRVERTYVGGAEVHACPRPSTEGA
ncbi:MAG: dihydroorotase [Polyangiales bacterium]